jgi:ribonuclease HII
MRPVVMKREEVVLPVLWAAAAVVLPADYEHPLLNDSKKLNPKQREKLRIEIEENALDFAVAFIDNHEIDQINIQKASIKAMHKALDKLKSEPEHIIVDGNRFYPYHQVAYHCIVRGDGKYYSIAAASVLAKTYRDDYMSQLHKKFPGYGFINHKGYPTKAHRAAIVKYGITNYHRRSFQLLDKQLEINF